MQPLDWHLYRVLSAIDYCDSNSGILNPTLESLRDLGVGPQVERRIQAALADHLAGNPDLSIYLFVPLDWQAAIPPPEGWRFFIVTQGGQVPARCELYLY